MSSLDCLDSTGWSLLDETAFLTIFFQNCCTIFELSASEMSIINSSETWVLLYQLLLPAITTGSSVWSKYSHIHSNLKNDLHDHWLMYKNKDLFDSFKHVKVYNTTIFSGIRLIIWFARSFSFGTFRNNIFSISSSVDYIGKFSSVGSTAWSELILRDVDAS